MPRLVKGPDGITRSFPDDATDAEIAEALESVLSPAKAPAAKPSAVPTREQGAGLSETPWYERPIPRSLIHAIPGGVLLTLLEKASGKSLTPSPAEVIESLPGIGGAAGSLIGSAAGGASTGPPGFFLGGGMGAGLGAAAGEAGKQIANRAISRASPRTSGEAAGQIGAAGLGAIAADLAAGTLGAVASPLVKPAVGKLAGIAAEKGLPLMPEGVRGQLLRTTLGKKVIESRSARGLEAVEAEIKKAAKALNVPEPALDIGATPPALVRSIHELRKAAKTPETELVAEGIYQEARDKLAPLLNSIGRTLHPQDAGEIIHSALKRGGPGVEAAKRETSRLYAAVDAGVERAAAAGTPPVVDVGSSFWPRVSAYVAENGAFVNPKLREVMQITQQQGGAPPLISYTQARQLQAGLADEFGDAAKMISADRQTGQALSLWQELSGQVKQALRTADPKVLEDFETANKFYSSFADTVKRGALPRIIKKDPSQFVRAVKDDVPETAQTLRTVLLDWPEEYGTASEKAAARDALLTFQRAYADQSLLRDGIDGLSKRLSAVDPRVQEAIFGGTKEGRSLLANAGKIAEAAERARAKVLDDTKLLETLLKESAVGKLEAAAPHFSPYADTPSLLIFGLLKLSNVPWLGAITGTVAAREAIGGFTAWALYNPQRAARFVKGLDTVGSSVAAGTGGELAALATEYANQQGWKKDDSSEWKYLSPPPRAILEGIKRGGAEGKK